MLKFGKLLTVSALTSSILSLSALAENSKIPDSYKFVPQDSLMAFDLKTSQNAWEIFSKNKSLKKINIIKELNKNNKNDSFMDHLFTEEAIKNMGENLVFSLSNFNFDKGNEDKLGLLLIEEMTSSAYVNTLKNKILDVANKSPKDYKRDDFKVSDIDILGFISLKKVKEKNKGTYFAFVDNYIVASDSKEKITESINSYKQSSTSLASSPDFVTSYNKLSSTYQFQFYLNNKKFVSNIYESKEMQKTLTDFNLNYKDLMISNTSLFNLNFDSKGLFVKWYSLLDKTNEKAKLSLESKPSNFKKYTNMIPKNTLLFFSASDLKKFGENISSNLPKSKDIDVEKMSKEVLGINIIDALKNLEEDFAVALFNTESSPLIPGFAVMMTPKDREGMVTLLNSIKIEQNEKDKGKRSQKVKKAPLELKFTNKSTYKDAEIFSTNEIPELAEMAVQPAYSFIGNDMILASNQNVLKSMIDRNTSPNVEYNLQGNENFSKAIKYFGEENNALSFINISTIVNMVSPFMQKEKDLKTSLTQLKKLEAIGLNSSKDDDGVYGNFAFFADMENIEFDKILPEFATKNFTEAQTRAKVSSVKANMHTIQTLVETHAVDWTGLYPNNIEDLKKEAQKPSVSGAYWKDLKNPMTEKTGLGKGGSIINYSSYISHKADLSTLKGMVIYQPLKCKVNKSSKKTLCESYKIYGTDEKGLKIKDKGKDFYLTNG
jgi:hypothetical protein